MLVVRCEYTGMYNGSKVHVDALIDRRGREDTRGTHLILDIAGLVEDECEYVSGASCQYRYKRQAEGTHS